MPSTFTNHIFKDQYHHGLSRRGDRLPAVYTYRVSEKPQCRPLSVGACFWTVNARKSPPVKKSRFYSQD